MFCSQRRSRNDVSRSLQKREDNSLLGLKLPCQREILGSSGDLFGGRHGDYGSLSSCYSFGPTTGEISDICIDNALKTTSQLLNKMLNQRQKLCARKCRYLQLLSLHILASIASYSDEPIAPLNSRGKAPQCCDRMAALIIIKNLRQNCSCSLAFSKRRSRIEKSGF